MFNRLEVIRESLLRQQELLAVVRDRHILWAKNTEYAGVKQIHLELAELFRQSMEKYNSLLDFYEFLTKLFSSRYLDKNSIGS